jgi:hypothetical protein
LLAFASSPTWAGNVNGNIGLFWDTDAALCQMTVPCNPTADPNLNRQLYVYALLHGTSASGITGAEFSVQIGANNSPDPFYLVAETFVTAATVVYGPGGATAFNPPDGGARGINVTWPTCQTGDGTKVLIEIVTFANINCHSGELALKVVKHSTSSNQFFQCPLFTLCDEPAFTKVCVGNALIPCANPEPPFPLNATCSTSGEAFINGSRNCSVGVQETNWSAVKSLFR